MAYEVTATRRRPSQFKELIGQDFVVSTIESSIKAGRIAHAYLFSGPRGVGKTSAARILAKAVNCESGPTPVPCGKCSACTEVVKGNSLDVIEIDGASNTSVNDIREIKDEVLFSPNSCRYKVYIIDEVHMLSTSAFNALLKTIEEPPPYVIFIFATTEIHKVPATIRSRCQQFNFRLISLDQIKYNLRLAADELNIDAEEDALLWIAKESTGSMRDAYTLFDQVAAFSDEYISLEKIKEKLGLVGLESMNDIVASMIKRDASKVIELSTEIIANGVSVEQFAIDLSEYFRSLLFINCGIEKESILGYTRSRFLDSNIAAYSKIQLEKALDIIFCFYRDVRYSINPRFELELMLSRLSDLSAWLSPVDIYYRLEALKADILSESSLEIREGACKDDLSLKEDAPHKNTGIALSESLEQKISTSPQNPEGTQTREFTSEEKITILDEIRKQKITLAASIEQAKNWIVTEDKITFQFSNSYNANIVRKEQAIIKNIIQQIAGNSYSIEVEVVSEEQKKDNEETTKNKQVEVLKSVFRGEIISGG